MQKGKGKGKAVP